MATTTPFPFRRYMTTGPLPVRTVANWVAQYETALGDADKCTDVEGAIEYETRVETLFLVLAEALSVPRSHVERYVDGRDVDGTFPDRDAEFVLHLGIEGQVNIGTAATVEMLQGRFDEEGHVWVDDIGSWANWCEDDDNDPQDPAHLVVALDGDSDQQIASAVQYVEDMLDDTGLQISADWVVVSDGHAWSEKQRVVTR